MNYPYSISPYIQAAMAQAMQAIMSGGPLPPNCIVVTVPIQQAQQMFPQLMLNYASGGSDTIFPQQQSYFGQFYQPQVGPYQYNQPSNALVPYSNYYSQGYNQNYNYPIVPYGDSHKKSKKKNRRSKQNSLVPHSNVYNSSSFDTDMRNLSWSRLFGTHHSRHHSKQRSSDQAALNYDQKTKRRTQSANSLTSSTSTSASSSTTSDETIRRVNVSTKPPSVPTSSSLKQQTKSSLPFKYSSEFVPGTGKLQQQQQQQQQQAQKPNKKEVKVKTDDVFIVKKTQPSSSSTTTQK